MGTALARDRSSLITGGVLVVVALAALAACTARQREVSPQDAVAPPGDTTDAYYREAAARGSAVYRIDPARSLAVIEVRRGGVLAGQ